MEVLAKKVESRFLKIKMCSYILSDFSFRTSRATTQEKFWVEVYH